MASVDLLRSTYRRADQAYRAGTPTMSDEQFDELAAALRAVAPHCPELSEGVALLSLDQADGIAAWCRDRGVDRVCVQPKIDGCTLACRYEGGQLVAAWTRSGRDALVVAEFVDSIPAEIDFTGTVVVAGELWCDDRNRVATALRVGRPGTGFVFSAFRVERGVELLSEIECLSWLCEQGFSCPETRFVAVDEIEQAWRDRAAGRFPLLGAPTDGIVVKISCWKQQRELGGSSRIPYWAIAVKSDADLLG